MTTRLGRLAGGYRHPVNRVPEQAIAAALHLDPPTCPTTSGRDDAGA